MTYLYLKARSATKIFFRLILVLSIFAFSTLLGIVIGVAITYTTIEAIVITLTTLFMAQSIFTLLWMLYAWEDPENVHKDRSPLVFYPPQLSFTALVPARHEDGVIEDTIQAINSIHYPEHLKEILILCKNDDIKTIQKARSVMRILKKKTIKLVIFDDEPINKPHALNYGLDEASNEVIVIFDAEDQPHKDIYKVANTVMLRDKADVLQAGVQLMNFTSRWFSALNCMEYFFWFKSGLHFFSKIGKATPLGGNTVFFKTNWLKHIGGWDEECLTEDADIGFRLIEAGARVRITYDEAHTTHEETPTTVKEFIKQRTRWNQGFLQILFKGSWLRMPMFKQKITSLYVILSPLFQSMMFLYIPFALLIALFVKMSVIVSLYTFIPFLLLGLQISTNIIGLYEFTKAYKLKFPLYMPFLILLVYFPYQLMLMFAAFRAFFRYVFSKNTWEKTLHINAHRKTINSYA